MKTKTRSLTNQAFTLVELLVVIVIIGILVGISVPVYQTAIKTAQMNTTLQNGRQIAVALRLYAGDSDGLFPATTNSFGETIANSNDAFRSLIPAYLDNEKVFTASRSKTGPKCDNKIEPPAAILKAGENHYAYIEGLNSTTNSNWPLILDGTNGNGKYTDQEMEYGGTWGGTKAVVISVDSSASIVKTKGIGANRTLPRYNDETKDALALSDYMGSTVRLLDPALP